MIEEKDKGVVFPDAETDYHGHPKYGMVLIQLLALFGISLLLGYFSTTLAIVVIFAAAAWKAVLVVRNFMHLRYEPFLVWLAVMVALFTILALFWGVFPDITLIKPDIAK